MLRPNGFHREKLKEVSVSFNRLGGGGIEAVEKAEINVTFGQGTTMRMEVITSDIVDIQYPYNTIFEEISSTSSQQLYISHICA
jgi:hypothetical protein